MNTITDDERKNLILSVGTHQSNRILSPVEVAKIFVKLLKTKNRKEVAEMCLISTDMVGKLNKLNTLPEDLLHLVDWGSSSGAKIGMSVASEISKLPKVEQQNVLGHLVMKHKLNKTEVKEITSFVNPPPNSLRISLSVEKAVEQAIKARPAKKEIFVIMAAITSPNLSKKLKSLTQGDRDVILKKVIAAMYTRDNEWNCSLGINRFTLSGNSDFNRFISHRHSDIETYFTEALLKEFE